MRDFIALSLDTCRVENENYLAAECLITFPIYLCNYNSIALLNLQLMQPFARTYMYGTL